MGKIITVNIGNKGNVLSAENNGKIVDRLFVSDFNQETLNTVLEFFGKYKNYNAYIVLDTVAQNYNYKIFPPLNYFDLNKIVARRFSHEIPKNDLKQRKFLYKNKIDKKSVYLFISASTDSPLREWLNFFDTIPNNLLGIYMLPLETVDLAIKIIVSAGMKNMIKEKNKWILVTFNDQTSDLRQVAVFNNKIAFTRLISLSSAGDNLAEFARDDIRRASEYIKRFDSDFHFDKMAIITILDQKNKEALKDLKLEKTPILNYTPYEIADELKLGKGSIEKDEKYCDLLLDLFIHKNKNRTRFGNVKINYIFNIALATNILKNLALFLFAGLFIALGIYILISLYYKNEILNLNKKLNANTVILQDKSKEEFGMNSEDVDKIIDAGSVKELIDAKYFDPIYSFKKFANSLSDTTLTYSLKWAIENFDFQGSTEYNNIKSFYDVSIINPNGDVNKLFGKYDILNSKLKETFNNELIDISKIPSNINFNKKYLTYPIKIEINENKQHGK